MDATGVVRRLNVTLAGDPSAARTIVFAHGFGSDQSAWKDVVPAFERDHRIVLYDHVGAGGSDPAAFVQHRYLKLSAYAADLVELGEALGLDGAIAVGHSMGGMICVLASIARPSMFSRLVLIGASARYQDEEGYRGGFSRAALSEVYSAMHANMSAWADGFAPQMVGEGHPPGFAERLAASLKSVPPQKALTVACAVFQSDHRADLPRVERPVLLVQSAHDAAVPLEAAEYLHAHLRGSRLEVIDANGHLPHVTDPDKVIRVIEPFVRGG